jgi:CCR4-NOT transcriptional regulation complex NOT5 subunit
MNVRHIDDLTNLLVQARGHAMATRGVHSIQEDEQQALEKGAYDIVAKMERILENMNEEHDQSGAQRAA